MGLHKTNNLVVYLCFLLLSPLQYDTTVMSRCMQFTFGDKKEVYLLDESALPVTEMKDFSGFFICLVNFNFV